MKTFFNRSSVPNSNPTGIRLEAILFDLNPPLIIVYPHALNPGSQAPRTSTVSGRLIISVEKADEWAEVVASLTSFYAADSNVAGRRDAGAFPSIACRIAAPGKIDAGKQELPFSYDLPCTAFPRSHWVDHTEANAYQYVNNPDDQSNISRWYGMRLQITRKEGDGRLATFALDFPRRKTSGAVGFADETREDWAARYQNRFFAVIASPSDPGELPPPLEKVIEEWAPQIGPVTLILTARSFTVGCLVQASVNFADFPTSSTLQQLRICVKQYCRWISPRQNGPNWDLSPIKLVVQTVDGPFERDGRSISVASSFRMGDDRFIGPSTLKYTVTPSTARHEIAFEIDILDADKKRKMINIVTPVTVASCTLISEWINVPSYGTEAKARSEFQPQRLDDRYCCACGFTFETLCERDNEGMVPADQFEQIEVKPREAAAS